MVTILNRQRKIGITDSIRAVVEKTVGKLLEQENFGKDTEVSVVFVSNSKIKEMNYAYRNINQPTDVLSFPMLECEDGSIASPEQGDYNVEDGVVALGDIVISAEKAFEQCTEYGHSFEREMAFLIAHGMLHLLGYDHNDDLQSKTMRDKEEEVLTAIGLERKR